MITGHSEFPFCEMFVPVFCLSSYGYLAFSFWFIGVLIYSKSYSFVGYVCCKFHISFFFFSLFPPFSSSVCSHFSYHYCPSVCSVTKCDKAHTSNTVEVNTTDWAICELWVLSKLFRDNTNPASCQSWLIQIIMTVILFAFSLKHYIFAFLCVCETIF